VGTGSATPARALRLVACGAGGRGYHARGCQERV